jgi:hypothetical protein
MNRLLHFLLLGLLVLTIGCTSQPADAQQRIGQKPNLLIMVQDHDTDSVKRDTRVYKRVYDALSDMLNEAGFAVYNETAITLDSYAQGRARRSDAELIDIARSVNRPPIDVVVFFEIYASARDLEYTTKVRVRTVGRLFNVRTSQELGNFEITSPQEWNAQPKCSRECILETIGDYAKILGNDVGAVISEKLAWMINPEGGVGESGSTMDGAYTLIFDGFAREEVMRFEEYLVQFSGYKTHRPSYTSARRAEYWYESTITPARLDRNLNRMLEEAGIRGNVQFSLNKITIQKITLRGNPPKTNPGDW